MTSQSHTPLTNSVDYRSIAAYVVPFFIYVVPTMFESAKWHHLRYEDICVLKGIFALCAFIAFHRSYPEFSMEGYRISIVAGVIGCVAWIWLKQVQSMIPGIERVTGMLMAGTRVEYDPFSNSDLSLGKLFFITFRLFELAVVVPLVEEVFWRGFLARFIIDEDFLKVRQGRFTALSFVVVTLAFASAHVEILSAVVWGLMINLVYQKTSNIYACVLMHSVTNGILGGYILLTQSWYLW